MSRDKRSRSVESATSVRVRDGETEITDGPFAVTKEVLAGYYILECADLDEALKQAARVPLARYGTIEVRPLLPRDEWVAQAREAGAELSDEAVAAHAEYGAQLPSMHSTMHLYPIDGAVRRVASDATAWCARSGSSRWQ